MDEFYKRTDISETEVTFEIKLPADAVVASYAQLLKERGKSVDIKGFRKGNVPSELIEPSVQELILTETFERLAPYYVNAAIIKEKLEPIAPPVYSDLGEMKKDQPIQFKVKVTIMPKFKLGDLKKIKVDTSDPDVKDSEIDETINLMVKNNAGNLNKKDDADKKDASETKADDEWAKKIAKLYNFDDVKDLHDLKGKLKDLLKDQKSSYMRQNAVAEVINKAIVASNIKVPQPGIDYEAQQREEAFMKDLENMKLNLRDFMKERELKYEDLKERWEKDAKEALEADVLLRLYSEERKVELTDDELKDEVAKIKESAKLHYEKEHAGHDHESHFDESVYDNPTWQAQIKGYLLKQKAYQALLDEVLGEEFFKPTEEEKKAFEEEANSGNAKKDSSNKDKKNSDNKDKAAK